MELAQDAWRALARSSPWRWRSVHFTRTDHHGALEAWVRRPGQLLVREPSGRETRLSDTSRTRGSVVRLVAWSSEGRVPQPPQSERRWSFEVTPILRPDGLVAERPDDWTIDYDDPMFQNYLWVAMLDPVELSEHTLLTGLHDETVGGRRVWRGRVRPDEEYDPRCPCCPLLWSEVSDLIEHEGLGVPFVPRDDYPDAYDVALDVETGIVVELQAIGGREPDPTSFSVTILDADDAGSPAGS